MCQVHVSCTRMNGLQLCHFQSSWFWGHLVSKWMGRELGQRLAWTCAYTHRAPGLCQTSRSALSQGCPTPWARRRRTHGWHLWWTAHACRAPSPMILQRFTGHVRLQRRQAIRGRGQLHRAVHAWGLHHSRDGQHVFCADALWDRTCALLAPACTWSMCTMSLELLVMEGTVKTNKRPED